MEAQRDHDGNRAIDPEILADLKLRASSERDTDRTRGMAAPFGEPKIVEEWPCRSPACVSVIGVTQEALDRLAVFNRRIASVGDEVGNRAPLDERRIMFCEDCKAKGREFAAKDKREFVEKVAVAIRRLKELAEDGNCDGGREERELLKKLRKAGHPDVDGLEIALRERAAKGGSGKRRAL